MSQIHLIALDQPYNGKILLYGRQGIRAADYACHLASREYGHKETFRALLPSSFQVLFCDANQPFLLLKQYRKSTKFPKFLRKTVLKL